MFANLVRLALVAEACAWVALWTWLGASLPAALAATLAGAALLAVIDVRSPNALLHVWLATAAWITIRAAFGVLRVWPGIGRAPLRG